MMLSSELRRFAGQFQPFISSGAQLAPEDVRRIMSGLEQLASDVRALEGATVRPEARLIDVSDPKVAMLDAHRRACPVRTGGAA